MIPLAIQLSHDLVEPQAAAAPNRWRGRAPPSYRREAAPHLGHRSAPLQIHSRQEMPTSPPNVADSSRIRSTSASSPGTISAVPTATPPLAIAGLASFSPISPSSRMVSANTSLPPRRSRQRSTNSPLQHPLAHRRTAEHHDFAQQQRRAFRQIDVDPARHPRPVEQDGLLRQPGEMRARRGLQGNIELRGRSPGPDRFFPRPRSSPQAAIPRRPRCRYRNDRRRRRRRRC